MKKLIIGLILVTLLVPVSCAAPVPAPAPAPAPVVPTPPTEPVPGTHAKGYVFVSILDFAFEYPEDWEMEIPEVIDGEDTESIVMFTKPGTPTTLIITVKLTNLTSLEEVKEEFRGGLKGLGGTILEEREIVVNGREGYEVIYKPIAAVKIRQVTFIVANGKSYILICSTAEVLYDEYEETFNNVINSFVIKYFP